MRKTLRKKLSLLVTLSMIIGWFMPMTVSAAQEATLPFTWTVGSTVNVKQYRPDGDWNVVKDGSDVYLLYADYDSTTGPFYKRFKGTTMDDLTELSAPVLKDFPKGSSSVYWTGANYSHWLCGINVGTDGKWYALVHSEYAWEYYGSTRTHFRRIGLATSDDKGATWYYKGSVITSDNNDSNVSAYYNGKYYDNGPADQKLFVDSDGGYYYLYYQHNWVDKVTSLRYQSMRVARSPISSNMAAGSWEKWYNGSWGEPGLGGRDSDVFMNCDSAVVFKSTYLDKFVAISRTSDEVNGGAACISTCTDMAKQDWTPNQLMTGVNLKWYNRVVDPTTCSEYTIGQNFRIYQSDAEHSDRIYTNVSFDSGLTTSSTYNYVYPSEKVPDGNSAWGTGSMTTTIDTSKIYKIISRWSSRALDVNVAEGTIIQWEYNDGNNQKWQFIDAGVAGESYYYIKNVATGKCLCIKDQSKDDGAAIVQWDQTVEDNQMWKVISGESGYFKLENRNSGKVIDLADGGLENGKGCIQWGYNGGLNQQFAIVLASAYTATAKATTLNPSIGADNEITMTVKNTQGNVDKEFDGAKDVTITGIEVAADGTYGSFNGIDLDANSAGAGQVISVNFSDGVGKANLKLNKADTQTIGFGIATVEKPATNTLTITPNATSYEAESSVNTFAGDVKVNDRGMCSGGKNVGDIGNGSANYVTFNNINAKAAGAYTITICYTVSGTRSVYASANSDSGVAVSCTGPDWGTVITGTFVVNLKAGDNTIKIYNDTGYGPDIDRIIVPGEPNPDTTAPAEVTGATVTAGDGQLTVTWANPTDADFDHVVVTGAAITAQNIGGGEHSATITGLTNGTAYTIVLQTVDAAGNTSTGTSVSGTPSEVVPDTTAPAEVTGATVTAGDGQLTVTWANPTDADFDHVVVTGAAITAQNIGAGEHSATITGLTNGTAYTIVLQTVDAAGNTSAGTSVSGTPSEVVDPDTTAPAEVTGATVTAGDGQLTVTWANPADADFDHVVVTGAAITAQNIGGGEHSATITGLTNGTAYTIVLQTVDAAGNTSAGTSVSGTPVAPTQTPHNPSTSTQTTTTATTTATTKVEGDTIKVEAPKVDKATGIAAATPIQAGDINKALKNAEADMNGTKTVTLEIPEAEGAKVYTVQLPTSVLKKADATVKFEIITENGTLVVPENMLNTMDAAQSQNVVLSVAKADISTLDDQTKKAIGNHPVVELDVKVDGKVVSWNNSSAPVTVKIPYNPTSDELANLDYLVVWYINAKGEIEQVKGAKYVAAEKAVVFTTTHFSKYTIAFTKKSFKDVKINSWMEEPIEVLAANGIIQGTSETNFSPNDKISRGEFIDWLVKTLGLTAEFDANFADVKETNKCYKEIGIAKSLGIVVGYNGKFSPDEKISRQDMAVMIVKALKTSKETLAVGTANDIKKYSDAKKISKYAVTDLATIVKMGFVKGNSNTTLNPSGILTRAEAAQVLYKIYMQK